MLVSIYLRPNILWEIEGEKGKVINNCRQYPVSSFTCDNTLSLLKQHAQEIRRRNIKLLTNACQDVGLFTSRACWCLMIWPKYSSTDISPSWFLSISSNISCMCISFVSANSSGWRNTVYSSTFKTPSPSLSHTYNGGRSNEIILLAEQDTEPCYPYLETSLIFFNHLFERCAWACVIDIVFIYTQKKTEKGKHLVTWCTNGCTHVY